MKIAFGALVAVAMTVALAAPVRAQSATGLGHYGSLFEPAKPLTPAPYAQIVQNQPANPNRPAAQAQATQKPSVVCGMTLLPANPKIDPAMKIPPPSNRRFPMLTMEPQICRSSAASDGSNAQRKQK